MSRRVDKEELLKLIDDEDNDCVLVFQHEDKELVIDSVEYYSDGIVYFKLKDKKDIAI